MMKATTGSRNIQSFLLVLCLYYSCFYHGAVSFQRHQVTAFITSAPVQQTILVATVTRESRVRRGTLSVHSSPRTILQTVATRSQDDDADDGDDADLLTTINTTTNKNDNNDNDDTSTASPPASVQQQMYCVTGVSHRTGPLNEVVARIAQLDSLDDANALIDIGAVWARMDALTEDDVLRQYDNDSAFDANARALYADLDNRRQGTYEDTYGNREKNSNNNNNNDDDDDDDDEEDTELEAYIEQMDQQRFRRVLSPVTIEAGTDLRIYPNPRRFPTGAEFGKLDANGQSRLLYEDTTFIVVDKPPMLPTQPDATNYYENCPGCVQEYLGPFQDIRGNVIQRPLLCHRVDACVGGCVVMSKDGNGQRVFQEFQRDRKLRKMYKAVTTKPVPLGMHLHWMWAPQSQRGKRGGPPCQLVSHTPPESRRKARQFWIRCVLEVTKSEKIRIEGKSDWIEDGIYYQNTIRLVTGRKHQVRAQLASLGCPIIGDTLYEPIAGVTLDSLESSEFDLDEAMFRCRVPTKPIGLQAAAILFAGIRAKARTPWWGDDIIDE